MKIAVAGDSAGEGLAKVLADHLKDSYEVAEISRAGVDSDKGLPLNINDPAFADRVAERFVGLWNAAGRGEGGTQ